MTAGDPLNKIGYKKGLVIGLIISSIGALLFIPAVNFNEYLYFLIGLFFIAFGFSLLQIVANPFVINLGDPAKGSFRLNLAGSINSLGTSVGPVLFAYALYGSASSQAVKDIGMEAVKIPFLILSGLLFFLAIFLNFSKLPTIKNEEVNEQSIGAFKFPQLTLGMLAIFIYVGVEVAIGSNLPALIGHIRGLEGDKIANVAAPFVSLYWGSLMIGRWTGAINVFDMTKNTKLLLNILIPFVAFSVVLFFNHIRGTEIGELYIYVIWIVLFIIANFMAQEKPARTLMLFGIAASIMMLIGIFSKGDIAIFSFMSGGLFCSVMWPCIFNLAIAGLGKYTNQGSSLLVMMIIGGAFIPPIQGLICDLEKVHPEGILNVSYTQFSYIVSTLCFLYLAWYGMKVRTILIKQGIDYDKKSEAGH
ncbi:MAG: major facilitator superfamily protein [Bacteroidetes bacterium OLB11]|nr:MAG: major facilitator superfamily protein [Bacteroidetes bacterium OLB11]